jgi:enoyl-CoA hydratase/carnithine racemase
MAIVETTMAGDGVARVTLNDPDRYNALTPALIDGLLTLLQQSAEIATCVSWSWTEMVVVSALVPT